MNSNNLFKPVVTPDAMPDAFKKTPYEVLISSHNFKQKRADFESPQMLIGQCMDFRVDLNLPDRFAFQIRTGGANMAGMEFYITYALSFGRLKHVAVIGHTDCKMAHVTRQEDEFRKLAAEHLQWDEKETERFFDEHAERCEIGHEPDFLIKETGRLGSIFQGIQVEPMLYNVDDHMVYVRSDA